MKNRKTIIFKVNDEVMAELRGNPYANQIDEYCWVIASECEVPIDAVETEMVECDANISDIDVTPNGLMKWTDVQGTIITGITMPFELGSDEHLDFMLDIENKIEDCLFLS